MHLKNLIILFSVAAVVLMAAVVLLLPILWSPNQVLAIHFDAFSGIDILGGRSQILGLLATALVIFLVNSVLAFFLDLRRHFLAQLLVVANLIFMTLVFVASLVIRLNNNF